MIGKAALLADLKSQVKILEADLRQRAVQEPEFATPLRAEWEHAHQAERTAATYETWLDAEVTQAAVAWVLGTVFLRFCEDNGLIDVPYLAGPGERLAIASERQQEFFERNPHLTDRDWIVAGFGDMSQASPVAAGLFDR
ncbi:MAG TPA: DNA methylase, partial [Streptosporangiaceae bacterium]|nr:DNA methylase [Streptosporangiaceae bacterium]